MKLLLFGELGPGALARSFEPGLAMEATVVASDPYRSESGPPRTAAARLGRRLNYRARVAHAGATLVETVEQLRPDAVLVVKGRGIDAGSITRVRGLGVPVALYYPDNPAWAFTDTRSARERLVASTLAVVWSERLARPARGGRRAPGCSRSGTTHAGGGRRRPAATVTASCSWANGRRGASGISPRSRGSRSRCGERDGTTPASLPGHRCSASPGGRCSPVR